MPICFDYPFTTNNCVFGSIGACVFVRDVRAFYSAVVKKMIAIFPFDDKVLADLVVLDPARKVDLTYAPSTYNVIMSIPVYFSSLYGETYMS